MDWKDGNIEGCELVPLSFHNDGRGWLVEIFRTDELNPSHHPVMAYISETNPGQARGPHEHTDQTDLFAFFSGSVRLFMWDARADSATYGVRTVRLVGEANPCIVTVPPGVVHAYRNDGTVPALILNCPNRLYAGRGKSEPVDEIRHEDSDTSAFKLV
ncbi:MAG: dTDP-4-dehydrorhamnose 3,5-epimerase family protein [Rhodothermia bacterium]|nr:MAG: dTDP-4-dehydrorhamnose 3,5-epimerase family protein [Rhodothermia bacterium]